MTKITLSVLSLAVLFLGGCGLQQTNQTQSENTEPIKEEIQQTDNQQPQLENNTTTPIIQTQPKMGETARLFINSLLDKLPNTYIVSSTEYWNSFDPADAQKAIGVKPCEENNDDPTYSPICYTRLIILEEPEKTDSLDEYIKGNKILSWYEGALNTKLVKVDYQENVSLVYTPDGFMCLGTGGDTCIRKQFIYHLPDGTNIMAEIHYWPFNDGELAKKPIAEIDKIIKIYEDILMGAL